MQCGVLFERIEQDGFPPGFYYDPIPSLGLTTHGLGVGDARSATVELLDDRLAEARYRNL